MPVPLCAVLHTRKGKPNSPEPTLGLTCDSQTSSLSNADGDVTLPLVSVDWFVDGSIAWCVSVCVCVCVSVCVR